MQKMKSLKAFTYRAVQLSVGQEFDADDEHVELFSTIGFAEVPKPKSIGERTQEYATRVMTAAPAKRGRPRKVLSA